jgi:hypothetical protein
MNRDLRIHEFLPISRVPWAWRVPQPRPPGPIGLRYSAVGRVSALIMRPAMDRVVANALTLVDDLVLEVRLVVGAFKAAGCYGPDPFSADFLHDAWFHV